MANIVLVLKKDGRVRIRVDYRDLNKATHKDDFPLPYIDVLMDNIACQAMYSFLDGFSRYNQVMMGFKDKVKTCFIIEKGTYYYKVIPFGLKNARVTYQRMVTMLFHDMIHKEMEVYMDGMVVKSATREGTLKP